MAKQNEYGNFARPRMLYGGESPAKRNSDRESALGKQFTEGFAENGPTQSKARLVRSYSRKLRRSSPIEQLAGSPPLQKSVPDDVIPSRVHDYERDYESTSLHSGQIHKRSVTPNRCVQLSDNLQGGNGNSSVTRRQLQGSFGDRRINESPVDRDLDNNVVDRQVNESVADIKVDESITDRNFEVSDVYRKVDESKVDRKYDDDVVNRTLNERVADRDFSSRVMSRKLSGSFVNSQLDSSPVKRKSAQSYTGRKSTASVVSRKLVESSTDRNFPESIIVRKSSRYSIKPTPVDYRRTSRISKAESRKQTSKSHKSRQLDLHISRLDDLSRTTSFFHRDFVDENLLISAAKLDSTLIRLFSHARDNNGVTKVEEDPGTALMPFLNYSQSDLINMDAVFWRVFPMDAAQRETLDQELPYIQENLKSSEVMRHLCDKSILTHMDYNQLIRTEGQGEKAVTRLMVKTLQRRGDKAYPAFLEALQAHNYVDICDRLAETERCLRDAMATDDSDRRSRSKLDHISRHQYQSGKASQLRTQSVVEASVNSAPPSFMPPANQLTKFDIDTGLTNHMSSLKQTPVDEIYQVKQKSTLEETHTSDLHIVNSNQLKKQLMELMAEFESLQREVIAMKTAPSPQGSVDTHSNSDDVVSEQPDSHSVTQEDSTVDTESIATSHPERNKDLTPVPSSRKRAQKSVSCIVL